MTFGWQLALPASVTSGTFALSYDDLMWGVGICTSTIVAGNAIMSSPFASMKLKAAHLWEENGLPISLTFSATANAGVFVPGPDCTVTDTGSAAIASHVKLVPKRGSIQDNWFATNSTGNLLIVSLNGKLGTSGSGTVTPRLLLRVSVDYVLNDSNAFTNTYTTGVANTLTGGLIYWRALTLSSNTWYPESYPGVGSYIA